MTKTELMAKYPDAQMAIETTQSWTQLTHARPEIHFAYDFTYYAQDDTGKWSAAQFTTSYAVIRGCAMFFVCRKQGDALSVVDSIAVGDECAQAFYNKKYAAPGWASYIQYLNSVFKTGQDPCGAFKVSVKHSIQRLAHEQLASCYQEKNPWEDAA